MKNILIFSMYSSPYPGNFISSLLNLANKLTENGYAPLFVFPQKASSRTWVSLFENLNIQYIDCTLSNLKIMKQLKSIVIKYNIVIMHTHFLSEFVAGLLSIAMPKLNVIVHIHSDFSCNKKAGIKNKIINYVRYKVILHRATLLSVSPKYSDAYSNIIYFPNAIDKKRVHFNFDIRKKERQLYGMNDDDILFIMFGWSPVVKGVDIAVQTIAELRATLKSNKYKLAIVCGENYNEEKIKSFIKDNTTCSGAEDFLIYLRPDSDVYKYHNMADIMLSSSRSEAFSYTILEALSIGNKCVVSDIPGCQWAKKYMPTYYYNSISPNDCVKSCINAINDYADYSNYRSMVLNDYDINVWCDKLLKIYDSKLK